VINSQPKPLVSNRKRIYAIKKKDYVTHIPHSDLLPHPSPPMVEQISYLFPSPLDITPSSSATLQATTSSARTVAPPSNITILTPPADDPTSLVPITIATHPVSPVTATPAAPSAPAARHPSDEETALIFRLCDYQVPPADVARIVAIMNGRDQTAVEEAQLLWRLNNLSVPAEDITLIVDAMQRRTRPE
jgi:hypothetical protein